MFVATWITILGTKVHSKLSSYQLSCRCAKHIKCSNELSTQLAGGNFPARRLLKSLDATTYFQDSAHSQPQFACQRIQKECPSEEQRKQLKTAESLSLCHPSLLAMESTTESTSWEKRDQHARSSEGLGNASWALHHTLRGAPATARHRCDLFEAVEE